ncbi:MAG: hypothetical protein H8E35_07765 [Ardenticatenia bacterium]|nr:hypothetical protein [Ardenticatenia bacterium]
MITTTMGLHIEIEIHGATRISPGVVRTALAEGKAYIERQLHETVLDVLPEDNVVLYDVVVTSTEEK